MISFVYWYSAFSFSSGFFKDGGNEEAFLNDIIMVRSARLSQN